MVISPDHVDLTVQHLQRGGGSSRLGDDEASPQTRTPLGGSFAFFADPDGHVWEVVHHPLYQLGTDGRPQVP
jgi:hypothetical protein